MLVGRRYDPRCPFADKESKISRLEIKSECVVGEWNVARGHAGRAGLGKVVVVVAADCLTKLRAPPWADALFA